jgi:ribose transport system substrate-binding protein
MSSFKLLGAGLLALSAASALAQPVAPSPPAGPAAQSGKTVVFIASDFRNGGVMGVYRGMQEACKTLGWKLALEDGQGDRTQQAALLNRAIAGAVHGIVFGGFDPVEFRDQAASARRKGIVLVGWHAAKDPGPTSDLFVNVSTHAGDVARIAAAHVVNHAIASKRPVGVVIFNDNQYAVANAKTAVMRQTIEACQGYTGCKMLAIENVRISEAATGMATAVSKLLAAHGSAWTYSLAINDVYFDEINIPLLMAKRADILHVSAGDGSAKALGRIEAGVSQQIASVAEPLKLHGYQLADELNRAMTGAPPSGFQSQPVLLTTELLRPAGLRSAQDNPAFEAAYGAIWSGR